MANTLTPLIDKITARGLLALREQAVMPRLVNGDFSADAAKFGDTIDVPLSSSLTASAVVPAAVPPSAQASVITKVQIPLSNWEKANFNLTDKEMREIDVRGGFLPLQTNEAIRALANSINLSLHNEYPGIYGYTGAAGTTPFGSDATAAINARKILHQQKAFRNARRGVLDFDAEANALALAAFADAEKTGENGVKIEGEIGRKYGIDWVTDDQVVTHTHGTLAGTADNVALIDDASVTIGQVSVDLDNTSLTGTIVKGDIFTVVGDTQTYVCLATVTAGSNAIVGMTFAPGAKVAWADNATLTIKTDHVVNMAFHRDAFALAMRPSVGSMVPGVQASTLTDPVTGISLRLELSRQYNQDMWEFSVLWGVKLVRPELATRIAG